MINDRGNRDFIASILFLAYDDAISLDRYRDPAGARRFIDPNNDLFAYYCHIIDLDPEWVAEGLNKRISKYDADHPNQLVYKERYRSRKVKIQKYQELERGA